MRAGPVVPLTEGQRELAASHVKFAYMLFHEYVGGCPWLREELESAALYGLVKGARGFRPGWGDFPAYARLAIRNEMHAAFNKHKRDAGRLTDFETANVPDLRPGPTERAEFREELADAVAAATAAAWLAPPCRKCGTTGGSFRRGKTAPARHKGLCNRCYQVEWGAAKAAREAARNTEAIAP